MKKPIPYEQMKREAIERRQFARFIALELDYLNDWERDRELNVKVVIPSFYKLTDKATKQNLN